MENAYRDHYAPVNLVEEMLVHQIAGMAWRLGRIEAAIAALLAQVRNAQMTRFFGRLDLESNEYLLSRLDPSFDATKFKESVRAETKRTLSAGGAEKITELNAAEKQSLEEELYRLAAAGTTMLEAFVPATEIVPHECLDRLRHSTMRAYITYDAKLTELQERRRTVTLMPSSSVQQTVATSIDAKRPRPTPPDQPANQNHPRSDNKGAEKSAGSARTRRQLRMDRADSQK
jgi:hypothetical protein